MKLTETINQDGQALEPDSKEQNLEPPPKDKT